ncbi:LacI family transcriptional regulator [bacterium]|nr:MAG: LacI family transcriptional regulator [bacterium]
MPRPKRSDSNPNPTKRVTLQDIAKVAGLHVMTVSDALSGARSVAPATKDRVKQIARELNYVPNSAAKALATGRTGLIAIMSGSLHEAYYANMVAYLEKSLYADRYTPVLLRRPGELEELIAATGVTVIDGAIAIDMNGPMDTEALMDQFRNRSSMPCVCIGPYPRPAVDYVAIDLSEAISAALRIMLGAGRQRIAYLVTAAFMAQPEESRARAYIKTMQQAGREVEIINVNTNILTEVEPQLKTYIERNGCPDALLCQNDETAMSAFRALRDSGFRVPEDVLLVGCDGQLHMKYFDTPLSTIVQPLEDMCNLAWKFLKNRIENPSLPQQHSILESELVVRDSLLPRLGPRQQSSAALSPSATSVGSFYPGREENRVRND